MIYITDLPSFVAAFRSHRVRRGMSQLAVDDRAGLTGGHTGKMEQWRGGAGKAARPWGRMPTWPTMEYAMGAIDVALVMIPKPKPKPPRRSPQQLELDLRPPQPEPDRMVA